MDKLIFVILAFLFSAPIVQAKDTFQVIIDPGHGGNDVGAIRGHIRESDISLAVGKKIREELKNNQSLRVSLTRESDTTVSLAQRSSMARRLKGDLFISIHVNSNLDPRVKGAEFYFKNQLPPEEESLFLANRENEALSETVIDSDSNERPAGLAAIKEDLETTYHLYISRELGRSLRAYWQNDLGISNAKVRQGPFHVISQVPMPSLLIELGFVSNASESRWLSDPSVQGQLATHIAKAILEIKEKMDKNTWESHIAENAN
jgi:N-acetylmuramoyl-L-alanine amidase